MRKIQVGFASDGGPIYLFDLGGSVEEPKYPITQCNFKIRRTYPSPDSPNPVLGPRERAMGVFKFLLGLEPEQATEHPLFATIEHAFVQHGVTAQRDLLYADEGVLHRVCDLLDDEVDLNERVAGKGMRQVIKDLIICDCINPDYTPALSADLQGDERPLGRGVAFCDPEEPR